MPATTELAHGQALGELVDHAAADLLGLPAPGGVARHLVRDTLTGWADAERIEDAILVTSELVGNAAKHGGGPLCLIVDVYTRGAVVTVVDNNADVAAVSRVSSEEAGGLADGADSDTDALREDGRGLFLIAHLATSWSVNKVERGKAVVAVFALPEGGER